GGASGAADAVADAGAAHTGRVARMDADPRLRRRQVERTPMDDWKITRDRKGCEQPGCPLPSARHWFAVLEVPACGRRELCEAWFVDCERRTAEPLVFWRAQRPKTGSKEPVLDLASLRVLFDRLGAVEDDRARSLRYFCALLLLRKRMLKMV